MEDKNLSVKERKEERREEKGVKRGQTEGNCGRGQTETASPGPEDLDGRTHLGFPLVDRVLGGAV